MRRRALVTGAARGIGAAIVTRLLAEGLDVLAIDRPGTERPTGEHGREDVELDVTNHGEIDRLAARVDRLYALVNNAGIFRRLPLGAADHSGIDAGILSVNATAPRRMIEAFVPCLAREDASAIVNIASVRGLTASENASAYSVSKAIAIDLTREMAERLKHRIRCNAIAPGDIATGMTPPEPEIMARLVARIPLGRLGRPDEVASAVAFLLSARSRGVNGAVLAVDGGFLCS